MKRVRKLYLNLAAAAPMLFLWIAMGRQFPLADGDFGAFYTGAVMGARGEFSRLHDGALQQTTIAQFTPPHPDPLYFVRSQFYAAFLSPLALLGFKPAFAVFVAVQSALFLAICVWAARRFGVDVIILLGLFPTAVLGMAFGQDPVFFLALSVLSYYFFEKQKLFPAGFALGLALVKPHLLLLFPVAMLIQKRWKMLWGFVAAGALEAAISLALGGWPGIKLYLEFLRRQQGHLTPTPERMINFTGLLANLGIDSNLPRLALSAVAIAIFLAVCMLDRNHWWRGLAIAQLATVLIAPHVYLYDSTMLLLPALLVFFNAPSLAARAVAVVCFAPIPYLLQLFEKPLTIAPSATFTLFLIAIAWDTYRLRVPAAQPPRPHPQPEANLAA